MEERRMIDNIWHLLRLWGWLVALGLAVLIAGFVVDQVKQQVAALGRIPGAA
jgi:hypothetical protein